MLENLPLFVSIVFILATILTLLLVFWTVKNSTSLKVRGYASEILVALVIWLIIQGVLTLNNIYSAFPNFFPPTILLFGILPALITVLILFVSKTGQRFMDSLMLTNLTCIHLVRIPVELVLYWLFLNKFIPELMTYEGRNFDIIAGLTAPIVIYFGLIKSGVKTKVVLLWNVICLGLLLNIVVNAFLSAPSPVQKFAFDQPNIAILHFPFSWLPTFIVPVVLLSHLISIRKLIKSRG